MFCTSRRGGSTSTFSPSPSRVGECLPEALGRGADVDLEDLFHGVLQFGFEVTERGGPGLGVLAHPPVVYEPERNRIQEVQLLPAPAPGHDEACFFQQLQVLHHTEPADLEACFEGAQGLAVFPEELVQEAPAGRIGQCLEHLVHALRIRDHLVTCQARSAPKTPPTVVGLISASR
jgi:hypothetical protein